MKILNNLEVSKWLFEHAQIQGHICTGIKGIIDNDTVNIAFRDETTGEIIYFEYE